MIPEHDLDLLLRAHFEAHADRTLFDGQMDAIGQRTATVRQRPGWLARLRSITMSATSAVARPALPRTALALAALGLLIVLAVAALAVGGLRLPKPRRSTG